MSHEPTNAEFNAFYKALNEGPGDAWFVALTAANALRDAVWGAKLAEAKRLAWVRLEDRNAALNERDAAEARADAAERALADARWAALEEAMGVAARRLVDMGVLIDGHDVAGQCVLRGINVAIEAIRALASASPQAPQSPVEE